MEDEIRSPLLKRLKPSGSDRDEDSSSAETAVKVLPIKSKPNCTFGLKCYRRNIHHLLEYAHPQLEEIYMVMKNKGNFDEIPSCFPELPEDTKALLDQVNILRKAGFKSQKQSPASTSSQSKNVNRSTTYNSEWVDVSAKSSASSASSASNSKSPTTVMKRPEEERASTPSTKTATPTNPKHFGKVKMGSTMQEKWEASLPFNYFLTKVTRIPQEPNHVFSANFVDLFHPSLGEVKALCHMNFMVEANWFTEETIKAGLEGIPTRVLVGVYSLELESAEKAFPWLKVYGIKSPFPYGHHHTKMTFVQYTDGSIRFIIYTANLIDTDWENRTQGIWIGPKCPRLPSKDGGDSSTKFKVDILQYMATYPVQAVGAWIDIIRYADCSPIKVYFIGSAPVMAKALTNGFHWGIKKMEKILKSLDMETVEEDWPLIVQCSSIGSLGHDAQDWVEGELGRCMAGKSRLEGPVYVIYPSYSNVKESFDGLQGGGCLPYSGSTHMKQTWLERHLCQWKADCSGRTKAVPHIKSYCRVSPDHSRLAWFVVTSANLSKAAWGKLNKKKDKLLVMSWEAGVLFTPQMLIGSNEFEMGSNASVNFPVHIDLPVTKYTAKDKPWFMEYMAAL